MKLTLTFDLDVKKAVKLGLETAINHINSCGGWNRIIGRKDEVLCEIMESFADECCKGLNNQYAVVCAIVEVVREFNHEKCLLELLPLWDALNGIKNKNGQVLFYEAWTKVHGLNGTVLSKEDKKEIEQVHKEVGF